MNDTEIEQTLRATFAGRANTVASGPLWTEGADLLDTRRARRDRRRSLAPLAAAAAVLIAVGGGLVAAQQLRSHPRPALQHHRASVVDRPACTASLAPSWRSAITAGTTSYGKLQLAVAGVTSDGTEIVDYSSPGASGSTAIAIGTLATGSRAPHRLAEFTRPGAHGAAYDVQVEGTTVLVAINFGTRASDGIDGAPSEIAVIDARTGARTDLLKLYQLPRAQRPTTDTAVLFGGAVYWDEYPHELPNREVVHRYDIATRTAQVVYDGTQADQLQQSAAGVWWTGTSTAPNVPARLPAAVAEHATSAGARESLTTDGTSYAWSSKSALSWWSPGHDVVTVKTAHSGLNAVAGPIVVFGRNNQDLLYLLDTRTGSIVAMPGIGVRAVKAGVLFLAKEPHLITNSTVYAITRLDTSSLPPLRC